MFWVWGALQTLGLSGFTYGGARSVIHCWLTNALCLGDPSTQVCTCTYVLTTMSPAEKLCVLGLLGCCRQPCAPKSSNYKPNISWCKKLRIHFCYLCSINSRFVSAADPPSPAPVRNVLAAMFNQPVNQKLVTQGLFAFGFLCNEGFDWQQWS